MIATVSPSDDLLTQAAGLLAGERDPIANAASLSALVYHVLDDVNWVGFYFTDGDELVVGPFQGKPACVRIPLGRGVCGKAAASRKVVRVTDVLEYDDHIVCDVESRSEIVLPLIKGDELIGVFDIDSPSRGRFSAADEALLRRVVAAYLDSIDKGAEGDPRPIVAARGFLASRQAAILSSQTSSFLPRTLWVILP